MGSGSKLNGTKETQGRARQGIGSMDSSRGSKTFQKKKVGWRRVVGIKRIGERGILETDN